MQVSLSVIERLGSIIGYAIHADDGNIYELAFARTVDARAVLSLFARNNLGVSLSLHVSPSHPIIPALGGLDITWSVRECSFGGHMVRVIDPVQLAAAAARRIEQRARSLNLAPGIESADGLHLVWDGQAVHVRLDGHINSLALVGRLLGAARVSSPRGVSQFDPSVSFNILLADQV